MYKIIEKRNLAENLCLFEIKCERLARVCEPGQFLIVKIDDKGERIPLTICDFDREKGTVIIVIQIVGATTTKICSLNVGDSLQDVVGPLGNPSDLIGQTKEELEDKKIILIAGGLGAAPVYPQAKFLSNMGVKFDVIIGSTSKNRMILEEEYKRLNADIYVCTDDESYGFKGPVTNILKKLCDGTLSDEAFKNADGTIVKGSDIYGKIEKKEYGHAVAIGSANMMKFSCMATKDLGIPTIVSMNTLMVDGTGMCGACRLMVGDELKFCCIDGPEFDGHKIDFDAVIKRQKQYETEEGRAMLRLKEGEKNKHCACSNG